MLLFALKINKENIKVLRFYTQNKIKYMKIAAIEAYRNGNRISPMKGKKHKQESKKQMRTSRIKSTGKKYVMACPNFSLKACEVFYWLNREFNFNGKHALNDGEYYIKKLGYFVDYYEPNLNVVIEFDEKKHYNPDGTLKQEDVQRQKEIEEHLNCKFIRIKENEFENIDEFEIIDEILDFILVEIDKREK